LYCLAEIRVNHGKFVLADDKASNSLTAKLQAMRHYGGVSNVTPKNNKKK